VQSTSDLDHLHARPRQYSRVKFHDDPISGRRGDSGVQFSFVYIDSIVIFMILQYCHITLFFPQVLCSHLWMAFRLS